MSGLGWLIRKGVNRDGLPPYSQSDGGFHEENHAASHGADARIQFMASYVTFAIYDTSLFQSIGKSVQKIAQDVYQTLGLPTNKHDLPPVNPLNFMGERLNISKTQATPQEQDIAAYKVCVMRRTDGGDLC